MIYCDEAGNTGERLLDEEQPFFILASNNFGKSEALALLEHVRSPQGGEPKFKTLKKTPSGINRLIRLLSDPRLNRDRVFVTTYDKRFLVITKLVDLIAETLVHESGGDLYKNGQNLALSNILYFCMPVFCGSEATDQFLQSFVDLIREKTEFCKVSFFSAGERLLAASSEPDFTAHLEPFTNPELFHIWFGGIGSLALEPAIPALFQHISEWGVRSVGRFRVIHDQSKPVLASQEFFERMMAKSEIQSNFIGYDRRKTMFPLRAETLEQADSRLHPQLQLADICAGAFAHYFKCRESEPFDELTQAIFKLGCLDWAENGAVIPSMNVTPASLGTDSNCGVNPIDAITKYYSHLPNCSA